MGSDALSGAVPDALDIASARLEQIVMRATPAP